MVEELFTLYDNRLAAEMSHDCVSVGLHCQAGSQ